MRLRHALSALGGLTAAGAVILAGTGAAAVTPVRTAWWNEAPFGVFPVPGQVAANELAVGREASGNAAVAAVDYELDATDSSDPASAGATLTLRINTGSSVGTPSVVACPVAFASLGWKAGGDQPGSAAPKYDCSAGVEAPGTSPDGSTVVFHLTPSQQAVGHPGTFNLAIVPDPATNTPFQLVVEEPSDSDFQVSNPPAPAGAATAPASGDQASGSPGSATAPAAPPTGAPALGPSGGTGVALPAPAAPLPSGLPVASGAAGSASSASTASAARSHFPVSRPRPVGTPLLAGRRVQVLAWWLMIDAAVAVGIMATRPTRGPRLLGSLATRRPGPALSPDSPPLGGIGRFARPRTDPPRRL